MRKLLHLALQIFLFIPLLGHTQKQPSAAYSIDLIKKYAVAIGIPQNELDNWRVSDSYFDTHANLTYVYLQQVYKGIDIENAISVVAFKNETPVTNNLSVLKGFTILNSNTKPQYTAASALVKAANELNLKITAPVIALKKETGSNKEEFGTLGISTNNIPVRMFWTKTGENPVSLQLAWEVMIAADAQNALWKVVVDGQSGNIINKTNLTVYETSAKKMNSKHNIVVFEDEAVNNAAGDAVQESWSINSSKFNVIPYPYESPAHANPALITNPWTVNQNQNANTVKWNNDGVADYKITRGNNTWVQEDHDKKDNTMGYAPSSSTNAPDLNFNFTPDFFREPTDSFNMNFNLTNLFYWTNLIHDLSYQYGFDEPAGNFQASNLSRGGNGNDYVIVDGQDSSSTNNANFATPSDGARPRMQMFLFNPSTIRHLYLHSPVTGEMYAIKDAVSRNNTFLKTGPVTANIVAYNDDASGSTHLACTAAANGAALKNNIAYIDRGSCAFTDKIKNAQNAGALGVIVANYSGNDTLISMGGTDFSITIPAVFTGGSNGDFLKSLLATSTVNATLHGPAIDGSVDNTIPAHEYTHGISNRLVGGASNVTCLLNDEQMGEGWSDWYALMITQNWPASSVSGDHIRTIGNYAIGYDSIITVGLRYFPYSTNMSINPWTYDSLATLPTGANFDTHTVGEIWCAMLWQLTWKLIDKYGIGNNIFDATQSGGNNIALSLITQGMKLTSCSPGFVSARDGILKADSALYGGKYSPEIWAAFAQRGLGFSASQGSPRNTTDGTAAYDLPIVLPVTFGSFTAEKKGTAALLKWTTAQEINANKFVIERSMDGKPFISIGEVKATGNSSVKQSYQFTDASPNAGNNFYHIKEIDNDGKFMLSEVRSLNFADAAPSMSVYPNPATDVVTINIPGNTQNLTVQLLSNTGQLINSYVLQGEQLKINVAKLAAGMYNISIKGSGFDKKYKLLIQ